MKYYIYYIIYIKKKYICNINICLTKVGPTFKIYFSVVK